ncbi:hypothetical protein [Streptacidiphilus jiangxiensis]|uniref:Uncharacterized protein n=1 Tax=Streptacidiphilus jiangxiensis TaxID=235985 RepID=A0A1H8AG87_STRJI|nr:hypothetical protein [Streptacidiphilus jiangxiensis]SEM69775.1 hypothetical protein SAMN05414137_1454 [Streptacidiphilus jiangxiensis]
MSILDTLVQADAVTRVRVLTGEDADAERRADKKPIGKSDCTYYCPDAATAERCIEALRASDERLRERPEELMLWDWQCTYWEAEPGNPNGGGTVLLGVAWYDEAFFADRRDAWFGAMHQRIYQQLGIPLENITVTHWSLIA